MEVNYKEEIPDNFIQSNHKYIQNRIECYEYWFNPTLERFLVSDRNFLAFLINDCEKIIELANQNLKYAANHLKTMRNVHKNGQFVNHEYEIDSQVDHLTRREREFLNEAHIVIDDLNELHERLSSYIN